MTSCWFMGTYALQQFLCEQRLGTVTSKAMTRRHQTHFLKCQTILLKYLIFALFFKFYFNVSYHLMRVFLFVKWLFSTRMWGILFFNGNKYGLRTHLKTVLYHKHYYHMVILIISKCADISVLLSTRKAHTESTPAATWDPEYWDLQSVSRTFSKQRNVCVSVCECGLIRHSPPDILWVCLSVNTPPLTSYSISSQAGRGSWVLNCVGAKHWSELLWITPPLIRNYDMSIEICDKWHNYSKYVKIYSWHSGLSSMLLFLRHLLSSILSHNYPLKSFLWNH